MKQFLTTLLVILAIQQTRAQVSGTVFRDLNANGSKENNASFNEVGMKDVTVKAYDASGAEVGSTTSSSTGAYSFTGLTLPLRIEFTNFGSASLHPAANGSNNTSSVQFYTAATSNADFAVNNPAHYSQTNPDLVTPKHLTGDPFAGGSNMSTEAALFRFPNTASGNAQSGGTPTTTLATQADIGSTWGVAYDRARKKLFMASVYRRHAPLGPGETGGRIYFIDNPSSATPGAPAKFIDLVSDLGISVGSIQTNSARGLPGNKFTATEDAGAFSAAGKVGLGDIDISDDGQFLFVVNLFDKKVYKIDIAQVIAGTPNAVALPDFTVPCSNGNSRPWGLGMWDGELYLGVVCDGLTGANADLRMTVQKFNFNSNTWTEVMNVTPDWNKGDIIFGGNKHKWQKWVDDWNSFISPSWPTHPQPIIGDIEFDEEGSMHLAVLDRIGFQTGHRQKRVPDNGSLFTGITGGELLRTYKDPNTGNFSLENNGTCGPYTTAGTGNNSQTGQGGPNTLQGPGDGEFYCDDHTTNAHSETTNGGLAMVKGSRRIASVQMDPIDGQVDASGVLWLNTTNGLETQEYQIFFNAGTPSPDFSKQNGLGDLEFIADSAPIEIGNRVWADTDGNGIQDADEIGISGVTVELYLAGNLVGTTSTDGNGHYYFNSTNVNQNGATQVEANTAYEIRINTLQGNLSTYPNLTTANADASANGDERDSDGTGTSMAVIALTTGRAGENNHSYDFGFSSCIKPDAGADLSACAGNCINLTGTNPTTGTWSAMSGNPAGATLDPTVNGVAQVCFSSSASGTFNFIYNLSSGCEDTMSVTVYQPGSVGNYVWSDLNNNGTNDEVPSAGINGVTVELWNATTNTLVSSTTTANDGGGNPGYYNFTVCTSGDYKVKFPVTNGGKNLTTQTTTAATDNNSDASTVDGFSPTFTINTSGSGTDKDNPTIDAGYQAPKACLGNYVWNDLNQNGIQDGSEVGVSGVTTTLYDANTNTILAIVTTDAYGFYQFCALNPGDYKVGFTLPANYVYTTGNNGNDELDSDANPISGLTGTYTLASGDSNMTVDAGIYQPQPTTASVGDRVWFDANNNGLQDPGEQGVSGVTVMLYNCGNLNAPLAATVTDANGLYIFENLQAGSYQVIFSAPLGTVFTNTGATISGANNSDADGSGLTGCFTVAAGDAITYVDAGIVLQNTANSSLGDRVWNDANQNGIQDPNETGVGGVNVDLYDASGTTIIGSTTTDALGNYQFSDLAPGCYVVGFALPAGYTRTTAGAGTDSSKNSDANVGTGMTGQICLSAGQNNPTIDAGIYNASNTNSIGDRVWYDANQNGLQDGPEYGYPGVVVTLYACITNTIVATTTTNSNGNYLFDGLANGDYYVGFGFIPGYQFTSANSDAAGVLGGNNSDANPSSGLTACVTLSGNTHITTVDAGIYEGNGRTATSSLGDLVWVDANNNGLQDAGEPGVSGVTATLVNANTNTTLASTITDGLGNYIFTNLTGGLYRVEFSNIPAGYTFTTQSGTIEDELNSDANATTGVTADIPLGLGEDKMSVDAGIVPPSSTVCLGDYVWFDFNNNGVQEGNETPVPGVTVKLYDNNTNTVLQVTTTNRLGKYLFCGLSNGNTYSVGFENLPAGYGFTVSNGALSVTDNSDANPATGRTTTVTLGSTDDLTLDAGIYSTTTAVVGNYVWYDEDADGIQDPTEAPIPGVLVTLYDNTNTPVSSAVTDANGGYLFTNVTPGNYVIGFSGYPGSLVPTSKGSNASADDDSNIDPNTGLTDVFTVTPGSSNLTLDAGYKANPVAGLGNYVWHDVNKNGLQDPSEAPIAGVVVTLYGSDGTTPLGTAITDGNGAYGFPNLTAGSYIVGFGNIPIGFTRTQIVGGLNDALNSDIDASNKTALINLAGGTYNPNIDAGFYFGFPLGAQQLVATMVKQQGTKQAVVYWFTQDEENTAMFEIQRSNNGSDFITVGTKPASGHTEGQTSYMALDDISSLEQGVVIYYRIKLIDIDAQQKYSNTVSLKVGAITNAEVVVHPIPFTNRLTFAYLAESNETIKMELLDMSGRIVASREQEVTKGLNHVELDNLERLSSSQYLLRIIPSGAGETHVIRVAK